MTPNISAYFTSIRPYRWMRIHEMLVKSGLTFEIVIVGPTEPKFELPKEFRFFQSNVKALQCAHAAAHFSIGETLLQIADDVDYQDGGIRAMFDAVMARKVAATCSYYQNNVCFVPFQNIAGKKNGTLPMLPVCGMYKRHIYEDLGGIDKRFTGVMGELDLYQRIELAGYKTEFVKFRCDESTSYQDKEKTSLCKKCWHTDRPIFVQLWSTNGTLCTRRNDVVRPYENNDTLLTVNQTYP